MKLNSYPLENITVIFIDDGNIGDLEGLICSTNKDGEASLENWTPPHDIGTYNLEACAYFNHQNSLTSTNHTSQIFSITVEENTTGFVWDVDENRYRTVKIGNQWWMAENLKTTLYADEIEITPIRSQDAWNELPYEAKAYCWYDNDNNNKDTYGALYTWGAAMNGEYSSDDNPSGIQGVCPDGWHLPSRQEWIALQEFAGGQWVAGGKLKETGYDHWDSPNLDASDDYGFTALPGGTRYYGSYIVSGIFNGMGHFGAWWCSTEYPDYGAFRWNLTSTSRSTDHSNVDKNDGCSVRCVKD